MKRQWVACKSSWTIWPKGMRDVIRWKHAALLALAILAAGCSSNSKKELPPAELTDFKEEVVLQKQWSRSIGDGQGQSYNMLVPAIDGDTIYAADVTGVVMAMDRSNGDVKWKKDLELPVSGAVGVSYGLLLIGTIKGEIARQRLAQVLGAQNKADEALKLLEGDADKAFLATREELKGDLLVQLGRTDEASTACLLYTSPSPRDLSTSRMPSSA